MSRVGKNIKNAVGTAFRGTGALIAGSAGVASHVIGFGAGTMSGELGDGFSQIGNACFDAANFVWTGKKQEEENLTLTLTKQKLNYYSVKKNSYNHLLTIKKFREGG